MNRKKLVVLVADLDMENMIQSLLGREKSFRIHSLKKELDYDIYRHPNHDGGCRTGSAAFLRSFTELYEHALVIFDLEGCGGESEGAIIVEEQLEAELSRSGWSGRAKAIAISPELESWVWSPSPQVAVAINWKNHNPCIEDWLLQNGWSTEKGAKPSRPKEALESALREGCRSRSAAIYSEIGSKASFTRCTDRAFLKLKNILVNWFAAPAHGSA